MPPLSVEERAALKESIRANGVLVPVEEDEHGNLLDGHHRVELWHELRAEGVKLADYPRIIRPGLSEAQKRAHARALNLSRRHLSREQRRELIEDQLRETPEQSDRQIAEALHVDNKTVAARRRDLERREEIPHVEVRTDTKGRSQPARRTSVIAKDGREAKRTREALARAGDEAVLPAKLLDVKRTEHLCREAALFAPVVIPPVQTIGDASLRVGSLTESLVDVPDSTVGLILTDPPYLNGNAPLYADLSLLASRILKDDSVLVAYHGKHHLPDFMNALGQHLDYHWLLSLVHGQSGPRTYMHGYHISVRWKALLLYVKKGCNRRPRYLEDVVKGEGAEKGLHEWQQGLPEAMWLIEKLTDPGELVVDPFLGSGTVAAAAVKLGRRFIGCDVNPGAVAVAQQRLTALSEEKAS
jgi:hypothetical protein